MAIKLGSRVRDNITGFTGIATGKVEFLHGCTRILIEPEKLEDNGKPVEGQYFDEQRVEVVKDKEIKVSKDSSATTGGPAGNPTRSKMP